MIVFSRKKDESIIIGDVIEIIVVEIRDDKVRLGIITPKEMSVHRGEALALMGRPRPTKPQPLFGPGLVPDGGFLVLSRRKNEWLVIDGHITVVVVEIQPDKVRIGIDSPREIMPQRREAYRVLKQWDHFIRMVSEQRLTGQCSEKQWANASGNLLDNIPANVAEEVITTVLQSNGLRIERIVSQGQASPPGFWYDQDDSEWVIVVEGNATVQFEGEEPVELQRGSYLNIPAHRRHRVTWTDPQQKTVWLAVHYQS
jgi:cupin 2 domain-containing protein